MAESQSQSFPVKTKELSTSINGVSTTLIVNVFVDRVFIIITQCGTLGTLMEARVEQTLDSSEPTFTTKTLMGKRDEPIHEIYARTLVELVGRTSEKALLLSLALKDNSGDTYKQIIKQIVSMKAL